MHDLDLAAHDNTTVPIQEDNYTDDVLSLFENRSEIATPLYKSARQTYNKIKHMLVSAPAFVNAVKASVPKETFQAILTDKQKEKLASGVLKLMTRKDGSLMANLVNPKTSKIVSTISLEKVKLTPELSQAMTSYTTQMQMVQIAEEIQHVQVAIEDVRQGQEHDRLATAYSCKQKLLQAMSINNPHLKSLALLQIVSDAEDSRNLLMQSQKATVAFLQEQPESIWGKLFSASSSDKIDTRIGELRDGLAAVNMVSLVEAMAYQELGETGPAQVSLQYYGDFIKETFLDNAGLVNRLDMIDPSPEQYWSKALPEIERKIKALPKTSNNISEGELEHGTKSLQE